ncbi:MAG: ergothioneine biosynthesis protein EgtB [Planctomycetota bacterium]|nr:MAG: ergothioneine biosynthesis protein EgtB [Planctomycetota bacterium]
MTASIADWFAATRKFTERLCEPLAVEDFVVQSMPDASPTRWHLAHTTWFYETFVLARWEPHYRPVSPDYHVLFNSYYNTVGEQFPRSQRGLLTRPTVAEVFDYRHSVDERVMRLFDTVTEIDEMRRVVELGIHHEQQHQELLLTDIKHAFSCNPLWPAYRPTPPNAATTPHADDDSWIRFEGGVVEIGHNGRGFAFDNERPRHRVLLEPFELHNRLVTAGEYLQFIEAGGYARPELWLSLGWAMVCQERWQAPLYWTKRDGRWFEFTLGGLRAIEPDEPVCHVSYFEADAYARFRDVRLPTEAEWEHAAGRAPREGGFVESELFHPAHANGDGGSVIRQMFGELWQWTQSPYTPYPGYAPPRGALGEYNGKFMCNQYVLRGGSCATPATHVRPTYRNFFPPESRWQFSGIRLARDTPAAD